MVTSRRFNPHLTGYGLEALFICICHPGFCSFNPHLTGYGLEAKQAEQRVEQAETVSILILLDTGWKDTVLRFHRIFAGFNPHLTGYGLEGVKKTAEYQGGYCFNPHLTGYGLEVTANVCRLQV